MKRFVPIYGVIALEEAVDVTRTADCGMMNTSTVVYTFMACTNITVPCCVPELLLCVGEQSQSA